VTPVIWDGTTPAHGALHGDYTFKWQSDFILKHGWNANVLALRTLKIKEMTCENLLDLEINPKSISVFSVHDVCSATLLHANSPSVLNNSYLGSLIS
jgi:hypothetical protein